MEQKFRFKLNLFDGIVLVLCLCAGIFLGYKTLKPAPAEEPGTVTATTMRYTVKFRKMLEGTEMMVEPGDKLVDAVKNYNLGTVVATEVVPYTIRTLNQEKKEMIQAEVPGYVDLLVTVESDSAVVDTDAVMLSGGYKLRVNSTLYIKGEGYMASGPVISIEREGQA